mmetsp:Transcript_8770/g.20454  ORF Transcript_8770/g.20454 Transcript_8770/m.20454 type:complete len:201 (-) Transcript_8770:45-647(-)
MIGPQPRRPFSAVVGSSQHGLRVGWWSMLHGRLGLAARHTVRLILSVRILVLHVLEVLQFVRIVQTFGHVDAHDRMVAELIGPEAHRLGQVPGTDATVLRAGHGVLAVPRQLDAGHMLFMAGAGGLALARLEVPYTHGLIPAARQSFRPVLRHGDRSHRLSVAVQHVCAFATVEIPHAECTVVRARKAAEAVLISCGDCY